MARLAVLLLLSCALVHQAAGASLTLGKTFTNAYPYSAGGSTKISTTFWHAPGALEVQLTLTPSNAFDPDGLLTVEVVNTKSGPVSFTTSPTLGSGARAGPFMYTFTASAAGQYKVVFDSTICASHTCPSNEVILKVGFGPTASRLSARGQD